MNFIQNTLYIYLNPGIMVELFCSFMLLLSQVYLNCISPLLLKVLAHPHRVVEHACSQSMYMQVLPDYWGLNQLVRK